MRLHYPVAECWKSLKTYHRSLLHLTWRLQQAAQFALDFLPPYSPELNPIEHLETHGLCLHNRYFGFLDSVVDAVETQFADWAKPNEVLRSLCAII
jgi:hypothetical protein